jgi:arylsulfatase A-like enzyme
MMKSFYCILVLLILAGSIESVKAQKKPGRKPNVILILADDLGYGDLSSFGQQQWSTPNIDGLAAEGVKFTHFYTSTPYCAPSRASLLTGLYPVRHGLTTNPNPEKPTNSNQPTRGDTVGIAAEQVLLSELFQNAGYATKIIGKWHLGHQPHFLPTRHGFDEYYGIPYSNDMPPVVLLENEKLAEYPVVQATLTQRYTQQALQFIEQNKDKPFFLYLPHAMPHKPLVASEQFYTPEIRGDLYADVLRELDWSIGEVLTKVSALNLEQETIILFLSDNGPWFGGSTEGLRGMKSQNWEGGIRVPLLVQWKGHLSAGHISNEPAGTIDIFPTLVKLAGLSLPKDLQLDGTDISSILYAKSKTPHDVLFSFHGEKFQTVRSGKWKLHLDTPEPSKRPAGEDWVDPRAPDGVTILAPFEQAKPAQFPGVKTGVPAAADLLFDLENDPSEQVNVAAQHPEVVKLLRKKAEAYMERWKRN